MKGKAFDRLDRLIEIGQSRHLMKAGGNSLDCDLNLRFLCHQSVPVIISGRLTCPVLPVLVSIRHSVNPYKEKVPFSRDFP
jgi:hypothetical protein